MNILRNLASVILIANIAACGGGSSGSSTPSDAGSNGPVSVTPTPAPGATPAPTPTPGDAPTPTPAPPIAATPTPTQSTIGINGTPATSVGVIEGYSFVPTVVNNSGSALTFSITNKPAWASFNTANGELAGTPGAADIGTTAGIVISAAAARSTPASLAAFDLVVTSTEPTVTKLEVAQTHVIPAEGKTWSETKLANKNFHLVGNRDAMVLVDITTPNGRVVDPVVEAYSGTQKVGEISLNAPSTLPRTEDAGPAYSTTAYWAILDKAWVKSGMELVVRANGGQKSVAKPVKVGAPTAFNMYTLPFYLFGLTEASVPLNLTAAPDQATRDEYFAKHPIADLQMINHPAQKVVWPYILVGPRQGRAGQKVSFMEQQGDGYAVMSAILSMLDVMRVANGDSSMNNQYYAPLLMAKQSGAYGDPGGGLGGGNVGTGDYSYKGVFIHEAGHAYGMPHANDGYAAGTYPYIGGSVKGSNLGYDQVGKEFLATFVPTTASTYKACATSSFPMGRQFDSQNRCVKQDPMQSGSGDQSSKYKYTMFSDFNAGVVQRYLEGLTTLVNGKKSYSGGKYFLDATSATGYSRWDSIDAKFVAVDTKTVDGGLYGLDNGFPMTRDVPVHTIILTAGLAGITESSDPTKLDYADTVVYDANLTQIYSPISYSGNLRRMIDPTDAKQLATIVPDTSENSWYCKNAGCDYTVRVTYVGNSVKHIVLQTAFRGWFNSAINTAALDPSNSSSFRTWAVNVPATQAIKTIELLETPEVYKGFPASPKVIATRVVN